jgi:hypothetical protein
MQFPYGSGRRFNCVNLTPKEETNPVGALYPEVSLKLNFQIITKIALPEKDIHSGREL